MLNQYYKFLSNRVIGWLKEQKNIEDGDRFFILLDDKSEVFNFFRELKDNPDVQRFNAAPDGLDFETIYLLVNGKKVLFVATEDEVTQDFLVTIRNRVSEQKGIWQETSVFFIVHDGLDSIIRGSFDVSQKDAPFNISGIKQEMKNKVKENTLLKSYEKSALELYIDEISKYENTILKDFETIFSIMEQGEISKENYNKMGYFYDSQLESFEKKDFEQRLKRNQEIYSEIEIAHSFFNIEDKLLEKVSGSGLINELKKEDLWKETDYNSIERGMEQYKRNRTVKINFDTNDFTSEDESLYRLESEKGVKSKRLHIIQSAEKIRQSQNSHHFEIPFDDRVQHSSLIDSNTYVIDSNNLIPLGAHIEAKNKKLLVTIPNYQEYKTYGGSITYRHKNEARLSFKISFMIVPFSLSKIQSLLSQFIVNVKKTKKLFYLGVSQHVSDYHFGDIPTNEVKVSNAEEIKGMEVNNSRLILEESAIEEDDGGNLYYEVRLDGYYLPLSIEGRMERLISLSGIQLERQRLTSKSELIFYDNKIISDNKIFSLEGTLKDRLLIEETIIKERSLFGEMLGDQYSSEELNIPFILKEKYNDLFSYYMKRETLPSIAIHTEELDDLMKSIVRVTQELLDESLIDGSQVPEGIQELVKIGRIVSNHEILLSPLSPSQMMYYLELSQQFKEIVEIPKENILETLNGANLAPYIMPNQKTYQAVYDNQFPRYLLYKEVVENKLSELSYKVIVSRLQDYISQYRFLFSTNRHLALNIAAINIHDEEVFFDAIINYFLSQLKKVKNIQEINPINIYSDKLGNMMNSKFNLLYEADSMDKLNELLHHKYSRGTFEDYEVLDLLKEKINLFFITEKMELTRSFFHISFYQFTSDIDMVGMPMENLNKNYALNGLISGKVYQRNKQNNYISGFGKGKHNLDNNGKLIDFMTTWNSLLLATRKSTEIYSQGYTLVNNIEQINESNINLLLAHSNWLTIINPDVDLSYFYSSSHEDLYVIHYMDQNSMSEYEAVTITNSISQYEKMLQEKIFDPYTVKEVISTKDIIKSFNILNGTWLLKLASNNRVSNANSNLIREKLSIISAYKELLGILETDSIYWVPVSLEEILRVSDMVGLSKKDGLFSSLHLGKSGAVSDDLLFMGIDFSKDRIKVHLLPIEVKVGINNSTVSEKAKRQLIKTFDILQEFLSSDNPNIFMTNYYKNFFKSVLISNLSKIIYSNVYPEKKILEFDKTLDSLMINDFDISFELSNYYGKGIIFEFTKDVHTRLIERLVDKEHTSIKVPERDAYSIVSKPINQVVERIQNKQFSFDSECFLKNILKTKIINIPTQVEEKIDLEDKLVPFVAEEPVKLAEFEILSDEPILLNEESELLFVDTSVEDLMARESDSVKVIKEVNPPMSLTKQENDLKLKRLLIGEIKGSDTSLHWEYGNEHLSNRHLFITGKSGQGKTYFVQTLLSELSHNNINSLVIDYTDGFLPNQLDSIFLEMFNEKVVNRFVYQDKLPINPFRLQENDFGGFFIQETEQDMVDRVVQVIDFVFDLGIQQRTLLSETILEGYKMRREDYRFSHLSDDLRNSEDRNKQTLYGRVSTLLSRDPFSYEESFDWNTIFGDEGMINIFQLKGYQLNIQKALIEFLLWDLFQYATRKGVEGNPLPIILDEVQNLNFTGNSPAVKVLREGRKFGISGIFATQSLDSIKGNDAEAIYNAAEQLHFLPPESQVVAIARSLTSDQSERKDIEVTLKNLLKGEALVYGPVQIDNKKLSEPRINKVRITSFEGRKDEYQKNLK